MAASSYFPSSDWWVGVTVQQPSRVPKQLRILVCFQPNAAEQPTCNPLKHTGLCVPVVWSTGREKVQVRMGIEFRNQPITMFTCKESSFY